MGASDTMASKTWIGPMVGPGGHRDAERRGVAAGLRLGVETARDAIVVDQKEVEPPPAEVADRPRQRLAAPDVVVGELDARGVGAGGRAQANQ